MRSSLIFKRPPRASEVPFESYSQPNGIPLCTQVRQMTSSEFSWAACVAHEIFMRALVAFLNSMWRPKNFHVRHWRKAWSLEFSVPTLEFSVPTLEISVPTLEFQWWTIKIPKAACQNTKGRWRRHEILFNFQEATEGERGPLWELQPAKWNSTMHTSAPNDI